MPHRALTPDEERVIVGRGTEPPGTGAYLRHRADGAYACRRCDAPLYRSADKFDSGCGWPAFDGELPGAVERRPDPDDRRTEIVCAACGGHLGHVFEGERLTSKNVRHCVNSLSLHFHPAPSVDSDSASAASADGSAVAAPENRNDAKAAEPAPSGTETAYFAGGCFWGVEYWFKRAPGVLSVTSGYMGGTAPHPTYEQVCRGGTGHAEAVAVVFDPAATSYEALARLFFEIHDFTQVDRQGPDIGPQYRSAVFYADEEQRAIADRLMDELVARGQDVATRLEPVGTFWPAEDYRQDYYAKTGKAPYCHHRRPVFA